MADTTKTYPLNAVRTVALHAQGLAQATNPPTPTPDDIYAAIEKIGCVQIDTLHMVQRSQYLAIWSRLGTYNPADFDQLIFGDGSERNTRRLFEYWLHAACVIPLTRYRYLLPNMQWFRDGNSKRTRQWLEQSGNREVLQTVQERIQAEGALRGADFKYDGPKRGGWWDWKPAKRALEILYNQGELMIADRVNFQRVYDFRERVLPDWVDTTMPTDDERRRHLLEESVRALGVCEPAQAADYTHMKRTEANPVVETLLAEGVLVETQAQLADGEMRMLVVHRDHLPLLEQAADGALVAERTTFLSPFDSLFWARDRDMRFWNFRKVLEAYKPAPERIWGYFCLPILHKNRLVGRFDPKLERKTRTLRLKALYLEPGIAPEESLVAAVAETMRDFMAFHAATELVIERSDPATFGDLLQKAL